MILLSTHLWCQNVYRVVVYFYFWTNVCSCLLSIYQPTFIHLMLVALPYWPVLTLSSFSPTTSLLVFSPSRSHQTDCRRPPDSVYQHQSAGPSKWGDPSEVWGETGRAEWESWLTQSRCLSNPSTRRTWGPAGPAGMMSSVRRHGPAELSRTRLHSCVWSIAGQRGLDVEMRRRRCKEVDSSQEGAGVFNVEQ